MENNSIKIEKNEDFVKIIFEDYYQANIYECTFFEIDVIQDFGEKALNDFGDKLKELNIAQLKYTIIDEKFVKINIEKYGWNIKCDFKYTNFEDKKFRNMEKNIGNMIIKNNNYVEEKLNKIFDMISILEVSIGKEYKDKKNNEYQKITVELDIEKLYLDYTSGFNCYKKITYNFDKIKKLPSLKLIEFSLSKNEKFIIEQNDFYLLNESYNYCDDCDINWFKNKLNKEKEKIKDKLKSDEIKLNLIKNYPIPDKILDKIFYIYELNDKTTFSNIHKNLDNETDEKFNNLFNIFKEPIKKVNININLLKLSEKDLLNIYEKDFICKNFQDNLVNDGLVILNIKFQNKYKLNYDIDMILILIIEEFKWDVYNSILVDDGYYSYKYDNNIIVNKNIINRINKIKYYQEGKEYDLTDKNINYINEIRIYQSGDEYYKYIDNEKDEKITFEEYFSIKYEMIKKNYENNLKNKYNGLFNIIKKESFLGDIEIVLVMRKNKNNN